MEIPSDYIAGYQKARAENPELASVYVAHTLVGDPEADAVIEELSSLSREESARLISHALHAPGAAGLPPLLQAFVERAANLPEWYDYEMTEPGRRAYNRHSVEFALTLSAACLVEGFCSGISKSFMYTGRLLEESQGVRRLRQNNRHQLEVFLPDSLRQRGDGWALTLRIRLTHAKIRRLINRQDDWDTDAWGVPVSAAHLSLANSVFSARNLHHTERLLGKRFSAEERASFMLVWRYTGYLMGVPEALLPGGEDDAEELFRIGLLCEAPVSMESVAMANVLVNSFPEVLFPQAGEARKKRLTRFIYRISRSLIGNELADHLRFPAMQTRGLLPVFAMVNRITILRNLILSWLGKSEKTDFEFLARVAHYEKYGISYLMPDNAHAELSKDW